jgi:GntR family transcriptional regulator/MocR family aminotransferase
VTALPFEWRDGPGPAHARLAASLRAAVTSGRLRPGERLPASRVLAEELAVSRWVVTEAYEQLKAEGHLVGRSGSGTVVAAQHLPEPPIRRAPPPAEPPRLTQNLTPNLPDLRAFPSTRWRAAVTAALAELTPAELGYPELLGDPRLRQVLADYLRRVRGLRAQADDVVVTSGTGHSLALVLRALAASGARRLAVEDPGWARLGPAALAAGVDPVPVPVDADGLRTDLLAADAAFVTPAHQFPTGVALAPSRRQQLLEWAAGGGLVLEDDYDAEFRFDRRPVGALAALGPQHVAYLGSTSKTLVPGLRIGWMVLPPRWRQAVTEVVRQDPAGPSTLDQRALALLVEAGDYDRHLRRMRRSYASRRAALVSCLAEAVPAARVVGLDAGVHCLLDVGDVDDAGLASRLARQGVQVMALSECRWTPGPGGILLGYANLPEHAMPEVAAQVARALREISPVARRAPAAGPARAARATRTRRG